MVPMAYNYEQSIWGKGYASTAYSSPTSFRLKQALQAITQLSSGSMVLELGCGAGQFIRTIQKIRPDVSCYGCDISATAIELAKKTADNVQYAVNGTTLPYADNSLDAVLIFDVLEHVEDPGAILAEIRRVLKPGGVFYAFVPCEGDWTSLWHLVRSVGVQAEVTKRVAGHITYFSRHSLRTLYVKHGFTQVRFRYSEHLLGQLLGFVAFTLVDRAAKKRGVAQINGEEYFTTLQSSVSAPSLFGLVKRLVNTLVYFESWLLQMLPSPNVHSVVRK